MTLRRIKRRNAVAGVLRLFGHRVIADKRDKMARKVATNDMRYDTDSTRKGID